MNYNVQTIDIFEKQAKRLIKKYPSLKLEILKLIDSLSHNPKQGISLGKNCYKIRLAIESKGKGKSGGARVISYFKIENETVYLISIYDKSVQSNIVEEEIVSILSKII